MAAIKNHIAKPNEQTRADIVEYESGGEQVKLSPALIRKYLVSGNKEQVSDQEVMMFLMLCKHQHLNPFLREAYLIKYGEQPATIVTGKEAFMKRAMRNPSYAGYEAGVVIYDPDSGITQRVGAIVVEGEQLVGGWARVYIRGWEHPLEVAVSFDEYCMMRNGRPASNWAVKPATMIRKVALVQALREAFPEDLGGLYTAEESGEAAMPIEISSDEIQTVGGEAPIQAAHNAADTPQAAETINDTMPITEMAQEAARRGTAHTAPSARDALFGDSKK